MTDDERPILAVDVDGVLLPFADTPPGAGWREVTIVGERVYCNPGHGARLLAIARETGAEMTWHTFWGERANKRIASLVGLPQMPVIPMAPGFAGLKFSQYQASGITKAKAMLAYAGRRPFCWLDDEAADAVEVLSSHPVPHLVVEVDERTGLQDEHLERARTWLREHVQPRGGDDG
jgi:hypothetical protein